MGQRMTVELEQPTGEVGQEARSFDDAVAELLHHARYEVVPLAGVEEKVFAHVPRSIKLTVTASPTKGLDPTLDLVERLTAEGYGVVPHVAARLVRDEGHLESILDRLAGAGVADAFVIAGDATHPAGEFEGAADLLRAIHAQQHELREIGITGYPEGHPFLDDETVVGSLLEKQDLATYVVSQICFDARVTVRWIHELRERGARLPIVVGVPGAVRSARLLRTSTRIGIGDSMRFLRKHGTLLGRLLLPGEYKPDRLIRGLAPALTDPAAKVIGFHVFTFNELEATERWRLRELERLGPAAHP